MKKILIFAMEICLLLSLLSCTAKVDDTKATQNALGEGDVLAVSSQEPIEITTTTAKRTTTEILADLIAEDGKGTLRPRMAKEELISILDKYSIKYEKRHVDDFEIFDIEDGTSYQTNSITSVFRVIQTKQGLKIGDPISKVDELYKGVEKAYDNWEGRFKMFTLDYGYEEGVGFHKLIIASGDGTTKIDSISIGVYQTNTF
jgi:hypothetical protein